MAVHLVKLSNGMTVPHAEYTRIYDALARVVQNKDLKTNLVKFIIAKGHPDVSQGTQITRRAWKDLHSLGLVSQPRQSVVTGIMQEIVRLNGTNYEGLNGRLSGQRVTLHEDTHRHRELGAAHPMRFSRSHR